jgi:uncharacterized membrane protein
MRESLAAVIAAAIVVLGLAFGRQGDGPDWLLGVLLVLVAVISIVATDGRRSQRERVVLGLVVVAGIAVLVWALAQESVTQRGALRSAYRSAARRAGVPCCTPCRVGGGHEKAGGSAWRRER